MFKELKFLLKARKAENIESFKDLLKEVNRPLPSDETNNIFLDFKNKKNTCKNLSIIFNHRCSEKEAYRREFNRPCPHCGNLEHMDSTVLDIIEKNNVYKLKKICSKCGKTCISEGNKIKK